MTLIAAHRGGALEHVENSPAAFRATALTSVDQVEFDIHPSADGAIVVIHDATLERTTDGEGEVCRHSLAQLKSLRLRGTEGAMLTLADVARIFAPTSIVLRMEVKTDARQTPYPGLLAQALRVLEAEGMRARTVVTSFNLEIAAEAAADPRLAGAIWLLSAPRQAELGSAGVAAACIAHQIGRVSLRHSSLTGAFLQDLRQAGIGVGAFGAHDTAAITAMLDMAVDVISTDRPSLALLLRDQFGRNNRYNSREA